MRLSYQNHSHRLPKIELPLQVLSAHDEHFSVVDDEILKLQDVFWQRWQWLPNRASMKASLGLTFSLVFFAFPPDFLPLPFFAILLIQF